MYETVPPPPPRRSRAGCWGMLFILVVIALLLGGVAAVALYWAGDPSIIEVKVVPAALVINATDPQTITVTIDNVGLDPVTVTGIGLDPDLLAGVRVTSMQPVYTAVTERSYPLFGAWDEYRLDTVVQPGDTLEVALTLEGIQAGVYNTDLTVWIESDLAGIQVARAARTPLAVDVR